MKLSQEQLREIYLRLPQDLRDAILGVESTEVMKAIGEKHKLAIDKIGEMVGEAGYVMLGVTHPNDFVFNLAKRLEIDKTKAKEIADDVNEQIFKKVRDSLRKIHDERDEGESISSASASEQTTEKKDDILKEIEKEDVLVVKREEEKIPDIFKGTAIPIKKEINPFEAKLKDEVYKAPKEETVEDSSESVASDKSKGYAADPYRESLE